MWIQILVPRILSTIWKTSLIRIGSIWQNSLIFCQKRNTTSTKKLKNCVQILYFFFFSKLMLWKVTKSNPKYNIFHANFALNIFFFHADFLHLDPDPHNNVCGSTSLANFLLIFFYLSYISICMYSVSKLSFSSAILHIFLCMRIFSASLAFGSGVREWIVKLIVCKKQLPPS